MASLTTTNTTLAGLAPQQWADDQTAEEWRVVHLDLLQKLERPS